MDDTPYAPEAALSRRRFLEAAGTAAVTAPAPAGVLGRCP
ncbi:twin-arginine translocation signal domain-containing protein [Actinacidiphila oryziradicis]|nr:twin-arginine translocation signal domain-containing protein [Actinacidiphila oryziradicis]